MAHLDLHEQEQINTLKYFWRDWGKYIISVLAIAIIAYVSSVVWTSHAQNNANKAALVFDKLTAAVQAKDSITVYKLTDGLIAEYPKVEYTSMAAITAAKVAYDAKNLDKSSEYLNWVVNNSKDKGLVSIAILRVANVYIDQNQFDKALQSLMQNHEPSFDVLFYSKRGDLYVAKGDFTKARDAYKEAIVKAGQDQSTISSIQMKLDVLGN